MTKLDVIWIAVCIAMIGVVVWMHVENTQIDRERLALDHRALTIAHEVGLAKASLPAKTSKRVKTDE